ncbi:hypothetical protein [Mycobacterium palustre]|uniref:Uncharacterized protein n=1 Tax=Mycobacterium palustre TaxID=153971 RepID=A0A1X1ZPN5_9MYCO|nr:hypothetical protein [Mycobacterium palustre]MCV7100629.1 hypothetical protein [Mycobacterium palustre]ORW25275.1 hypothetical protein AWC19_07210 [Mycobacterium palustre]ORW25319.1 hypothetical protein AWC19_07470 [Mycobacterium palustre]
MPRLPIRFGVSYGAGPLHLVTMASGFALLGYILATFTPAALWDPDTWWHSIAAWFAVAVIAYDLLLFPLCALADRVIFAGRRPAPRNVSARNHIRVPTLGAGLTLLIFLPGIIEQGAPTYQAATGQTQQPFLGRWLLLTAAMFGLSALSYAARLVAARRRAPDGNVSFRCRRGGRLRK